jgi:hypothetical protein
LSFGTNLFLKSGWPHGRVLFISQIKHPGSLLTSLILSEAEHLLPTGFCPFSYETRGQRQAEWLWKIQSGGARVDVRQYDHSLAGADYVCKCLGANAYELNKYSFANTVTLSARWLFDSGD